METYTYKTKGVCSREMKISYEDGIIKKLEVVGGCNGNLQGISSLVIGMKLEDVASRLNGIKCGFKSTSCPDQLANACREILSK